MAADLLNGGMHGFPKRRAACQCWEAAGLVEIADKMRTNPGASSTANAGAQRRDRPIAGIVWATLSMALLAGIAALGRHLALAGLDPAQVFFFRNLFSVMWMLPLLAWRGFGLVRTGQIRLYGLRVALSFVSMLSFFHAIALVPIGEVTAISFLSPLFGTLAAVLMLGEVIRARRMAALAVGFVGAMIMLRPTTTGIGAGEALALLSAACVGIIGPLVKQLTGKDDPDRIVFLTSLLMTPLSLVPALFVWTWPPIELLPALALMALAAVLGHMTLVRAYAATEATLVMTFKFSRLPFAVALGYVMFGEGVDLSTWIGAAIIFVAAAYVAHRETKLAAEQRGDGARARVPADDGFAGR